LGPRRVLGVVWEGGDRRFDRAKLRRIARLLDAPPMRPELMAFLTRAADYTLTPLHAMLRLATRTPRLGGPPATRRVYRRGGAEPARLTEPRARVLDAFGAWGGAAVTLSERAQAAGVTPQVIKGLVAQGAVLEEESPRDLPYPKL